MKAARSPREPPHQTPGPRGRVSQQRRRSPEPDCPRRSSPPGTRETRRLPAIDPLNEAPHLIPPQIAAESYSANQIIQCVFTQRGSNSVVPVMSAARPLFPRKRTSIRDLAMSHSCQNRTHFSAPPPATGPGADARITERLRARCPLLPPDPAQSGSC
jgi:hypothetical protein